MSGHHQPSYEAPTAMEDAVALLDQTSIPTVVLGGGTMLFPQMKRGERRMARLVDLTTLPGGDAVTVTDENITIGPTVTYSILIKAAAHPLLEAVAKGITGGPQIRNQGTIAGSACYANPASDMPAVLCALDAKLTLASASRGQRTLPAADFFRGAFRTECLPDEILIRISIPNAVKARWGYVKFKNAEGSWPIAVAAARLTAEPKGNVVTVTIRAATDRPIVLPPVSLTAPCQETLACADADAIREAVRGAGAIWWTDELADAEYRRRIAPVIAVRAVEDALKNGFTS